MDQGDIANVGKHLKGGCKEDRARLFSVAEQEAQGTKGNTGKSL